MILAWVTGVAVLGLLALGLWGEKDGMIPISNAADYLRDPPNATLVRLPNLGHVPFEEDPANTVTPVERFLSGWAP